MFYSKIQVTVLAIIMSCIMAPAIPVQGKAIQQYTGPFKEKPSESHFVCSPDVEVLKLCQRCARETKSGIVYPLCCEDKEDARIFCVKFLAYGLQ